MNARVHLTPAEALARLAALRGPESTLPFRHGTLEVEIYRPRAGAAMHGRSRR